MKKIFSFPNPVNEYAARLVAGAVMALAMLFLATGSEWVLLFLAYGFLARVATGPTLSPIGILVTRLVLPIFGNPSKMVAGPPKRFAQSIGLGFSLAALITFYFGDSLVATRYLIGALGFFASLESLIGFCAGCYVFAWLIKFGLIPEGICEQCVIHESNPKEA